MPNRYLIANWKMNLPPEGVDAYLDGVAAVRDDRARRVIAPPFPYLTGVARGLSKRGADIATGAQNCSEQEKGAFTGEVSTAMLHDCGARFTLIGHSERRTLFAENDALVARKLSAAIGSRLVPVLCVGEDLRVREAGHVQRHVADQLKTAVSDALDDAPEIVVAYEPIWAIGTGRNATGAMVADVVGSIRESLGRFWPSRFVKDAAVLYGGSVTPDNIADLVAEGDIDGFLVGGASLDSVKFNAILNRM
jgi:triosephosphate isomerase